MQLLAQTTTTSPDSEQAARMAALLGGGTLLFVFICFVIGLVIAVAINYLIMKKTGYNPWLALLCLVPGVGGLIILIMLAFTEWPIEREVRALRARAGGHGGEYVPPSGGYTPPSYPPGPSIPPGGPITPA